MVVIVMRPEKFVTVEDIYGAFQVRESGAIHASFSYYAGSGASFNQAKIRAEAFRAGLLYERVILSDKYSTGGST